VILGAVVRLDVAPLAWEILPRIDLGPLAISLHGINTQFYWSLNARSLMNFLSLRNSIDARYEIRTYAQAVERLFAEKMPVTYESFLQFGRMVP
jgi:hypothetical protein